MRISTIDVVDRWRRRRLLARTAVRLGLEAASEIGQRTPAFPRRATASETRLRGNPLRPTTSEIEEFG
jgi:hypothetical protein